MPLTHEDLSNLKRPFAVEDHEFHNDLVYLTEEAISNRLDEVDPSWEQIIIDKGHRPTTDGSLVFYCHIRIIVNGVTREGVGMSNMVVSTKSQKETNEPEKSAATDALKRTARLFGVGRYLLGAKGVKNENDLRRWLGGEQPTQRQSTPRGNPPQQTEPAEKQTTVTSVTVKKSNNGKPYLQFTTSDNLTVSAWSRQWFIEGLWITENEWTQGTTQINPPIPVTIATDGKYWNITNVQPMSDPFADDDPLEAAFPRKGKAS